MKRLGIYLIYDKQKKVDRYIGYFLRELKTCVSTLVVVCNMDEIVQGEEHIKPYADQVYFRKNIGFDAGGFKDALCNLVGWDTVLQYDELVLVNDTMFGPFCPMASIFAEMERRNADFWGLTKYGERIRNECHISENLESFFLVIRSQLLHDDCFQLHWKNMPYYNSFERTVQDYEYKFTEFFASLGYVYDSLADNNVNDSSNLENNYCQCILIPYELMRKRKFPFLKRKLLATFRPIDQTRAEFYQVFDYIEQETDYPVDLIWENLIRTYNMADIQKKLCLQYIISPTYELPKVRTAIVAIISYESSCEYVSEYLEKFAGQYEVVVCAEYQNILRPYKDAGYECRRMCSEELPLFLSGYCTYDYVCVLHDTDMTSQVKPSYVGKSIFYSIWENLIKDVPYLSGVIAQFEKKPRLGFLTAPQDNHGEQLAELGSGWNGAYQNVRSLVRDMGLNCTLSQANPPYRVTDSFWIRGKILKKLELVSEKDIPLLPYMWSYLAQDMGYYSGIVECAEYAAMNEINLQYYLDQICTQIRRQYGEFQNFVKLQGLISCGALYRFCRKYSRVYAYGTGVIAKDYQDVLPDVEAYIVSDGQPKQEQFHGLPVKYLSEIDLSDDCGIVLCLMKEAQEQVVRLLEAQNFHNYFCV